MKKKLLSIIFAAILAANIAAFETSAAYFTYSETDGCYYAQDGFKMYSDKESSLVFYDYTNYIGEYSDDYKAFFDMCINGADKEEIDKLFMDLFLKEDGVSDGFSLTTEQLGFLNSSKNMIMKINYTPVDRTKGTVWDSKQRTSLIEFALYTDKYKQISKMYDFSERDVYTTKEICSDCMIAADESVCLGDVFTNYFFNDLDSLDFYPCTNGWNTIDGEKYYVKSDGVLATKSMTINGVRYKFAKSGVCEGKYTGWTKTSKGKRYWKNGELLKNKKLRTKSGKVYKLDRNGYATLVV